MDSNVPKEASMSTIHPCLPYIVLFNGPPKNGKDTIAKILREMIDADCTIPSHLMHFATPMRDMAMTAVGEKGFDRYNEIKDVPQAVFARATSSPEESQSLADAEHEGDSIREFMIALSEKFMKARYGKSIWGRLLRYVYAPWWGRQPAIILIPDLGFSEEFEFLLTQTDPSRVLLVHVHRGRDDWRNDSRGWVYHPEEGNCVTVYNDRTPHEPAMGLMLTMRQAWPEIFNRAR
jgi:hypothetical protein